MVCNIKIANENRQIIANGRCTIPGSLNSDY